MTHRIVTSLWPTQPAHEANNLEPWAATGYRGSCLDSQQGNVPLLSLDVLFLLHPHHHPSNATVIVTAVLFACQVSGPLEQRPEQEVFYSCPSLSAEAFFEAVSNQLARPEGEGSPYFGNLESQLEQTIEVAQAVQASLCICFRRLLVSCTSLSL